MVLTATTKDRLTVIVADNSAAWRTRLVEMLSKIDGLEVIGQARDVPDALTSIRALRPGVVILDLQMPGGSGVDVLRETKADFPDIVVVILTNYMESEYRKKCESLQADYFLSKANGNQLGDIIRQLVRTRGQR